MSRRSLSVAFAACLTLLALPGSAHSDHDADPASAPGAGNSASSVSPDENASEEDKTREDGEASESSSEPDVENEAQPEQPEAPSNPFAAVPKPDLERSLAAALSDPQVSFCKTQESEASHDALLCSLSHSSVRQRCPGLRQACRIKLEEHGGAWSLAEALRGIADLAFWALLLALLLGVAVAFARVVGAAKFAPKAPLRVDLPSSEPTRVVHRAGEADVARLLAQAERSASAARFEEAVAAIQAALIHALRISGKLHVSPALTNGDYLRALRGDASLHGAARDVFRSVEAVQFGGAPASAELYRKLFERVHPIVTHALSALMLCLLCFSQSACSKAFGGDPEGGGRGFGVLTRLLSDQHTTVRRRVRALNVIEPEVSAILVIGEQPSEVWSRLLDFADAGGELIVTQPSPELEKATHVHFTAHGYEGKLELGPGFEATELELSAVTEHALELPEPNGPEDRSFAFAQKRPYTAQRSYGEGSVLLFADADFLSNASLSLGDNAFFVTSLLRQHGVLEIVGPWTGGGASSTFSSLFKAGLGTLLAQLALLAVVFGWHGGSSFGTRRDPVAAQRRAFRDHVLALGENYRRARATRFALATYGAWLIERLRDRLSPQQPIGLIDLAGKVAARVSLPESELVLLLAEARDAQDDLDVARPSPADLATLDKLETLTLRAGGSK